MTLNEYYNGITSGDPVLLAQAITLIESTLPADQELGEKLLSEILPLTENSIRIGITGIPGVGKSTFIEAFGKHLLSKGKKVAVLTIDPSSPITKGSILGDKTRMDELSKNKNAFIRPSSAGTSIGGVTFRTRESILLCEAAGYDVVIVETVGVGQSEVAVKNMVDFFLLLMIAGGGDELQGLKKGIIEMADALVITKADGDNISKAKSAQASYQQALHLLPHANASVKGKVLTCSALTNDGIRDVWDLIQEYIQISRESESFHKNREVQIIEWLHESFNEMIYASMNHGSLGSSIMEFERKVCKKEIPVRMAARQLFERYRSMIQ